ncbi:restriction endonuclease subunit S [Agromyces sp. ISL-38]|nr:restriction endonuclease subunit S [Agromyces sp. ISL-38]
MYMLRSGDIVVARTGASVGKSYRYRPDDGPLVFAGFLMAISPDPAKLLPEYLGFFLQTKAYWDWVEVESTRSGQPGINAQQLGNLPVPILPVDHQRMIARQLQAAEQLVDVLEQLIAKKRDVKQGMVQELLTGRTRLAGYAEPWQRVVLGSLGVFSKGRGIKRDEVRPSGIPCIRYGELYTTYRDYTAKTVSFVGSDVASTSQPIRSGDLLFAASGETKEEIGTCVAYVGEQDAVAGGDTIILRGGGYDPVYLATLLNTPAMVAQKASAGQGDAVVHISSRALAGIEFDLPEIGEQRAVAQIIRDADAEIDSLERRLESTRLIKRGMMQELLTGRTRLATTEAAA